MVEITSDTEFFKIQKKLDRISSEQSKGWHDYKQSMGGRKIHYYVDNDSDPKIALWGSVFQIPVLKKKLLFIEGQSTKREISEKSFRKFFSDLVKTDFSGFEISSNTEYDINFEIGLRRTGFLRPYGHVLCPLTIEIDLSEKIIGDTNWKRNYRIAQKYELSFKEIKEVTDEYLDQIISMYKELTTYKNLAMGFRKNQLSKLLNSDDIRTFMVYDKSNNPVAARIIHIDKTYATDIFAPNSVEARRLKASYFMIENLLETLRQEGFKKFDFGRIGPSTHSSDSVYMFKNSSKGRLVQYNGEWAYYRNRLIEYLITAYKLKYKKPRF